MEGEGEEKERERNKEEAGVRAGRTPGYGPKKARCAVAVGFCLNYRSFRNRLPQEPAGRYPECEIPVGKERLAKKSLQCVATIAST